MSAAVPLDSPLPPLEQRLLFLRRTDVVRAGGADPALYVAALTDVLRLHAEGAVVQPLKPYLRWRPDGHVADRIIAMPGYLGGATPVAGLKWIGSKHDNPSRLKVERASALIVLNDPETHYPIAVLEGALISGMRTAGVTAVAARHLACDPLTSLTVLGCGVVARLHLRVMLEEFPQISSIHLFDQHSEAARRLATDLEETLAGRQVVMAPSVEAAVRAGEVVVACTTADRPYLRFAWLQPGSFLSNVSLMDVHPEVFLRADKVVVDDWDQCNREGKPLHRLTEEGRFGADRLHAELGEVVSGTRPGREGGGEIVVLNPMGMALEDLACAQAVYHRALHEGIGTWLPLG